ncbi:hypothetical protein Hamer_G013148 [Homarus americanus]|uniref:Uncharacterized protein n=1 Tax=Homarus americanus TaxID=6706 RepID=A0A8J5JZV7_HOMAM|nr:hypothetical protein Hamer_G013148 [Homarus americanus]
MYSSCNTSGVTAYNHVFLLQHQQGDGLQPRVPPTTPAGRRPTTMCSSHNTSGEAAYNHVFLTQHQRGGSLQPCVPTTSP